MKYLTRAVVRLFLAATLLLEAGATYGHGLPAAPIQSDPAIFTTEALVGRVLLQVQTWASDQRASMNRWGKALHPAYATGEPTDSIYQFDFQPAQPMRMDDVNNQSAGSVAMPVRMVPQEEVDAYRHALGSRRRMIREKRTGIVERPHGAAYLLLANTFRSESGARDPGLEFIRREANDYDVSLLAFVDTDRPWDPSAVADETNSISGEAIASRLVDLIEEKGLTESQWSLALDMDASAVSHFLGRLRRNECHMDALFRFVKSLDKTWDDVLIPGRSLEVDRTPFEQLPRIVEPLTAVTSVMTSKMSLPEMTIPKYLTENELTEKVLSMVTDRILSSGFGIYEIKRDELQEAIRAEGYTLADHRVLKLLIDWSARPLQLLGGRIVAGELYTPVHRWVVTWMTDRYLTSAGAGVGTVAKPGLKMAG